MAPDYLLYSSCNPQTMAQDIARLSAYEVTKVQLFDMFPHTAHSEVLTLLTRRQHESGKASAEAASAGNHSGNHF